MIDVAGRFLVERDGRQRRQARPGYIERYDADGRSERMIAPISIPNTLACSPDGRTFYYADSIKQTLWACDLDPATGALGPAARVRPHPWRTRRARRFGAGRRWLPLERPVGRLAHRPLRPRRVHRPHRRDPGRPAVELLFRRPRPDHPLHHQRPRPALGHSAGEPAARRRTVRVRARRRRAAPAAVRRAGHADGRILPSRRLGRLSHLRAWVLDAAGAVLRHAEFDCGVNQIAPGEAPKRFNGEVRPKLQAQTLPALLCGAIGSNVGWRTTPYVDCPARRAHEAAKALTRAPGQDPPVWFVPGVRSPGITPAPDVLRGEETQAFGWVAEDPERARGRRLICHPGTPPKWLRLEDGRITRFVSAFTGEVFDLLGRYSILKPNPPYKDDPAAFADGVAAAKDGGGLLSRLYAARGRVAGAGADPATTPSFVSGVLVGAECATVPGFIDAAPDETIEVIGSERLRGLYSGVLAGMGWNGRAPTTTRPPCFRGLRRTAAPGQPRMTLDDAIALCPIVAILRGVRSRTRSWASARRCSRPGRSAPWRMPLNSPNPFVSVRRLVERLGQDAWPVGAGHGAERGGRQRRGRGRRRASSSSPNTDGAVDPARGGAGAGAGAGLRHRQRGVPGDRRWRAAPETLPGRDLRARTPAPAEGGAAGRGRWCGPSAASARRTWRPGGEPARGLRHRLGNLPGGARAWRRRSAKAAALVRGGAGAALRWNCWSRAG